LSRTLAYGRGCLIRYDTHTLDGVEITALILSAVDIRLNGYTLARCEVVKQRHLVASELYEDVVRIGLAVLLPRIIENQLSLLEVVRHLQHRRDVVNEGGC
jgi:hypothetical protein